jgi:two-component system, NarL family, invasion response regulator UvrY
MIRVMIADDHPVVRKGVRQILCETEDIVVVAEATSGSEVLGHMESDPCDIVLLDLTMPDSDGLDLLKTLRRQWPRTPILVLTMHSGDEFAVRTLRAGASGFLTKESAPGELIGAIRRIVSGGRYISTEVAERIAVHLGPRAERLPHERLSDREYQVLQLIASGKSTREMAELLSLSGKTVGTYRARILEKMNFNSTAELVAYAVRHRLLVEGTY